LYAAAGKKVSPFKKNPVDRGTLQSRFVQYFEFALLVTAMSMPPVFEPDSGGLSKIIFGREKLPADPVDDL